ncbi:MAG TPA: hypothetical protein VGM62_05805 [Chthoniobacterales bacterium]
MVAGLVSITAVFLRLGLWHYDLTVPVLYTGDALYETAMVKALTEGVWNYHIPRLGAPFGMDAVDFPIGCSLDFAAMKLMSFVIRNPCLLINLYWLASLGFAAAFATLLFRFLGIDRVWSVTFGAIYGILPWVFYRNIAHLNLVHFIVPAAVYLGLSLARTKSNTGVEHERVLTRSLLVDVILCCAIGLTYSYWAFFACVIVAIGTLIGFIRTRSGRILGRAFIYVCVIGLAAVADVSASLAYWHAHGTNTALDYKRVMEADIYALRIRELLTPIPDHPLPVLRNFRQQIVAAGFPNSNNESAHSSLGTIGGLGLLLLAGVAVARPRDKIFGDQRISDFSAFVIALILIAEVGGLGSLFNLFVISEFRAFNRVSPFVGLFSLGALAVICHGLCSKKSVNVKLFIAAALLVAASFDQIPIWLPQPRVNGATHFYEDDRFITNLESRLPPGSMIFELPNTGFPIDSVHQAMGIYDNARAYLHSKTLRWSWGTLDGRHHDWAKRTAALPPSEFLERIAFAGFSGVLIDRWGYSNPALERDIAKKLGPAKIVDEVGRWTFFDLGQFRADLMAGLSAAEIRKKQQLALEAMSASAYQPGTLVTFGKDGNSDRFKDSGWSITEEQMTWTEGKRAVLFFSALPPSQPQTLTVNAAGLVKPPMLPAQPVAIYANGQKVADWMVNERKTYTASIPMNLIKDDGTLVIELHLPKAASPASLDIGNDLRVLGLSVFSVALGP